MILATAHDPGPRGRFGQFGGQYVAETLMPALAELEAAWRDRAGRRRVRRRGRRAPHRLRRAPVAACTGPSASAPRSARPSAQARGPEPHRRAQDQQLHRPGAAGAPHGQARLIAETGAGQHGVATATVAALFGMPCDVYMGAEDVARQSLNVFRMKLLGARVIAVESGTRTLKDAMNEALRDWVTNVGDTFYVIGSVAGPHPYPWMVRELQAVIGVEARAQCLAAIGRLPDACVACVGGGSNAAGLFAGFLDDAGVALWGVEAAGEGVATGRHAATLGAGRVGVLHGSKSYVLTHADDARVGQIAEAHSISAGLDYPGVGPEHAHWRDTGRARYVARTDAEALAALQLLARTEGILCALETAHAVAAVAEVARHHGAGAAIIVNLSGRGDKDMITVANRLGVAL
jgi:tryptophan synthase beta chain